MPKITTQEDKFYYKITLPRAIQNAPKRAISVKPIKLFNTTILQLWKIAKKKHHWQRYY